MKKLLLAMALLMMWGCEYRDGRLKPDKVHLRSYVMNYFHIKNITLNGVYKEAVAFPNNLVISVYCTYGDIVPGSYSAVDSTPSAYDALCERHNDMSFDKTVYIYAHDIKPTFPAADFVSIEITSSADYDAGHPAGTPLNDLITAHFSSAKPYIDSGYKEYDNSSSLCKFSTIIKNLADVSAEDLVLLGTGDGRGLMALVFDEEPTLEKTHTFTVTMTPDDGREPFTASIDMTFD